MAIETQVPTFFRHPIKWAIAKRVEKNSLPENEFFNLLTNLIYDSVEFGPLLIFGYDQRFMEREETQQAIRNTITNRYLFPVISPYPVVAILSQSTQTSFLEQLANETRKVEIYRSQLGMPNGYMSFGKSGYYIWDSLKETTYPPEKDKGIILRKRVFSRNPKVFPATAAINDFEKRLGKGLNKIYDDNFPWWMIATWG